MSYWGTAMERTILNSAHIGRYIDITLPGFPSRRPHPEPCRIHVLEMGAGEPLLLVHSIGQSIYTWRSLMPLLAAQYRVIAVDLPGFGHSDRPISLNYSMDEMAHVLLCIMDALSLSETHLLGMGMGGLYAMHTLAKAPDRFKKVIALAPTGVTKQMPKKLRRMEGAFGFFARESFSKKDFARDLPLFYYDGTLCTEEVIDQYYLTSDDFASRQAIMYAIRNLDEDAVRQSMAHCTHELLVLWGEEDRMAPLDLLFERKKYIPNGVYHSIRNAGHHLHEEKAEVLAEVIDRYLRYQGEPS